MAKLKERALLPAVLGVIFSVLLMTWCFLVAPSQAFAVENTLSGEGTEQNPYLINDEADLMVLRDLVNEDATKRTYYTPAPCDGKYFALTTDIELSDSYRLPIGDTMATSFAGYFDGRGHTVSGLKMTATANGYGLFGYLSGTNVKNSVVIENLGVEGSVAGGTYHYLGGIAGYAGTNNAGNYIRNCYSNVALSGHYALGGILGYCGGNTTVENCLALGDVVGADNGTATSGVNKQMGGIVGYSGGTSTGSITHCLFTGQVKPTAAALADVSTTKTQHQTTNGAVGYSSASSANQQGGFAHMYYVAQESAGVFSYHRSYDGASAITVDSLVVQPFATGFSWNATVDALNGGVTLAESPWQLKEGEPRLWWQLGQQPVSYTVTVDPAPGHFGEDVTVDVQGRNIQVVESGKTAVKPANPMSEKGAFEGWFLDVDGNGTYSAGDTPFDFATTVTSDLTVVARYGENVRDTFIPWGQAGAPAGTPADPFVISTQNDLVAFAASVNGAQVKNGSWVLAESGPCNYAGLTVVLARDIALTTAFTPIGIGKNATAGANSPVTFNGIFDGKGHTVSGLYVTAASNPRLVDVSYAVHESCWFSALFGSVSDACVLNTKVVLGEKATFGVDTMAAEASAGLIAQVAGGETIVSCCSVTGDITGGASNVAGLVGRVEGGTLIMSCCFHQGVVVTKNSAGGLVGALSGAKATLVSCYQNGEVSSTSTSAYAANFYGQLGATGSSLTLTNCLASEAAPLCGANMVVSATGCLSGVTDWSSSTVREALGEAHYAFSEQADEAPAIGEGDVARYGVTFVKGSNVRGTVPVMAKQAAGFVWTVPASSLSLTGYVFAGWRVVESGQEGKLYQQGDQFAMPAGAVTFEAQWVEEASRLVKVGVTPATAEVELVDEATGASVDPIESQVPGQILFKVDPRRDFVLNVSAPGYVSQSVAVSAGEADLEQLIELSAVSHRVAYTLFGATWREGYVAPTTFTEVAATKLPCGDDLVKQGYLFVGWKASISATEYLTEIPAGQTDDITLFAWWQVEPETPATVAPNPYVAGSDWCLLEYTGEVAEGQVPQYCGVTMQWSGKSYVTLVSKAAVAKLSYRDFSLVAGVRAGFPVGDVNENGRVNIVDCQIIYDLSCGRYPDFKMVSVTGWLSADVNMDGVVEAADAFALQRQVMSA